MKIDDKTKETILDECEDLLKPAESPPGVLYPSSPPGLPGWVCPVCGSGNSPHSNSCPCTGGWVAPVVMS